MKCWICKGEATTGEHKVKKSTLKKIFKDDFQNNDMLHFKNNKLTKIQGVDSKKIKYTSSLCSKCNNEFTQPFDRAYDIFLDFIVKNYKLINQIRIINFFDIYGNNFPIMQTNLFKYFVKILGCDLKEHGFSVPEDLVDLLDKEHFATRLKISFSINEEYLHIENPTKVRYGIGKLITSQNNLNTKNEENTWYFFEMLLSYINVNFYYNYSTDGGLGSDWIANRQYVYIGSNRYKN